MTLVMTPYREDGCLCSETDGLLFTPANCPHHGTQTSRMIQERRMKIEPPPSPGLQVEIRQIGRHRWAAKVTYGIMSVGECGGPYAWSRKRVIKKAQRVVAHIRRSEQWDAQAEIL